MWHNSCQWPTCTYKFDLRTFKLVLSFFLSHGNFPLFNTRNKGKTWVFHPRLAFCHTTSCLRLTFWVFSWSTKLKGSTSAPTSRCKPPRQQSQDRCNTANAKRCFFEGFASCSGACAWESAGGFSALVDCRLTHLKSQSDWTAELNLQWTRPILSSWIIFSTFAFQKTDKASGGKIARFSLYLPKHTPTLPKLERK